MSEPEAAVAVAVEVHDGFVRLIEAGRTADFHHRWLRHNCDVDRHPHTGERVVDSAELPDALAIDEAVVEDGALRVRWSHEDRSSRFSLAWLRAHAYAVDRAAAPPPPSDLRRLEIDGAAGPAASAARVLERLARDGAAVIRRGAAAAAAAPETVAAETEAWIDALGAHGLRVVGTHFGRVEDLRTDNTTNANTDQLGYTDAGIDLHTDQPFLDLPPRYQLLHAVRSADSGGDSLLADARAAFAYLRSLDRDAAHRLASTPVRFHRKQRQFERSVTSPVISLGGGGAGSEFHVRSSYFTLAPYQVPFDDMDSWYRAHDRFTRIVRDPRHHYRFALAPGDAVIYDNHRMLHGRTAFRGARWVRGVYFDPADAA